MLFMEDFLSIESFSEEKANHYALVATVMLGIMLGIIVLIAKG